MPREVYSPIRHYRVIDNNVESFWGIKSLIPHSWAFVTTILAKIALGIGGVWNHFPVWGTAFLVSAFWLSIVLWLVRRHRLTWLHCDDEIHKLTHEMRDHLDSIDFCDDDSLSLRIKKFEIDFADSVAGYFAERLHNNTCGCCFRLVNSSYGEPAYVTVARSRNLGVGRHEISEPVFEDSGFIRMIKEKNSLGVWVLSDIKSAIECQQWPKLETNHLDHFDTVMFAPINIVVGGRKSMIGLLFVTAKGRVFQPAHTTALKGFSDLLGATLPMLYNYQPTRQNIAKQPIAERIENGVQSSE